MRRAVAALAMLLVSIPMGVAVEQRSSANRLGPFDAQALAGVIPEPMLDAYIDAAHEWDIDWALLAAIGKIECDHGRYRTPGCWPPGTVNVAGARGPMQFLGSTWRASAGTHDLDVAGPAAVDGQGYAVDGDGDGIADPWSAYDAVHGAARYLVAHGGREDPRLAAKQYNAGPTNPNAAAGEGYARRVVELMGEYHLLAGADGPGSSFDPAVTAAPVAGGSCTISDPTGTGGCVTPRTAHLVAQTETTFGQLPMRCWAMRYGNPTSDHPQGRACDITYGAIGRFPSAAERAEGWRLANWLVTNAQVLDIAYIIWDGRIWAPGTGWRTYTGGGIYNPNDPTGGHFDHVHVSVRRRINIRSYVRCTFRASDAGANRRIRDIRGRRGWGVSVERCSVSWSHSVIATV